VTSQIHRRDRELIDLVSASKDFRGNVTGSMA
jgi:hypothetical protein